MFTGLVEELGRVEALEPRAAGARLRVRCRGVIEDARPGASILVNGVCLTAAELGPQAFVADVAPETLQRSNLGELRPADAVNLERPLRPGDRLGGHIVQGHVDGTAVLESIQELGDGNWWLRVRVPAALEPLLVAKGSVALDGISLTIAQIEADRLSVAVIPHTFRHTTLGTYRPGARLNIEADILAKHVAKLLGKLAPAPGLTVEKLKQMGY